MGRQNRARDPLRSRGGINLPENAHIISQFYALHKGVFDIFWIGIVNLFKSLKFMRKARAKNDMGLSVTPCC